MPRELHNGGKARYGMKIVDVVSDQYIGPAGFGSPMVVDVKADGETFPVMIELLTALPDLKYYPIRFVKYQGMTTGLFQDLWTAQAALSERGPHPIYRWAYQGTKYVGNSNNPTVTGEIYQAMWDMGNDTLMPGPEVQPWFNYQEGTLEGYIIS